MNLESQVALLTIRSQPKTILDRLLRNEDLLAVVDLVGGEYPGLGVFDHCEIIAALQKIHTEGCSVSVRTKEGKECRLERMSEGIKATPIEDERAGRIVAEFEFLDPVPEVRLKALAEILSGSHPWFPSASNWQSILDARPLSEAELTQLIAEIHSSPTHFWATLQKKWRRGQITTQDLVPSSSFYYQSLIGPLPDGHNVDAYLHEVFKPHLSNLVERDFSIGLEFCLSAYLRDDLSPFSLLDGIADAEVIDAASNFLQQDSPFALLGILDIAVKRKLGDPRFEEVASETIRRLVQKTLVGKDGLDSYELMPPLVRLCYHSISVKEVLCGTPPYWRWLAAFVHAHFLLNIIRTKPLDVTSFSSWCDGNITNKMIAKQLIDMQQEPLWTAESLTPASLRAEIVGRLLNLGTAIQHQGGSVPLWDLVQREAETMKEQGSLIFTMCPGPLEGHLRRKSVNVPSATDAQDVAEIFSEIALELEAAPVGDAWSKLAALTRFFLFDSGLLGKIENVARYLEFQCEEENHQSFFNAIAGAAFIAATQPDETLADAVAATLAKEAANFNTNTDAETGYRLLLITSAAFSDRTKWLNWLGQKMTDYVYSLPKGAPCAQLHESLQVLKSLFPVKEWCFGRSTKLAAAAIH